MPLPDQPLRWLRPLHRPEPAATLSSDNQTSADSQAQQLSAADQSLQTASPQQLPSDTPGQSIKAEATGTQPAQTSPSISPLQTAATAQEGGQGPDPMQVDSPPAAAHHPGASHDSNTDLSMQSGHAQQEHLTLHDWLPSTATQQQSPPQLQHQQQCLPSLPEDVEARVRQHILKCDRQLLGKQEALLTRWLPQRVEDEVRAKHGAADVDDTAVGFVQQVWHLGPGYCVKDRNQCINTALLLSRLMLACGHIVLITHVFFC